LQHKILIVHDINIVEEMKTFTKDEYSERGASSESGSYDDVLMATMISLYCAHESDWDDNFGSINPQRTLTLEEATWHLLCQACMLRWPTNSLDAKDTKCPRCGNLNVSAVQNRTAESNKQEDGLAVQHTAWNPFEEEEDIGAGDSYAIGATRV
jgi:phage FluMu protein Com